MNCECDCYEHWKAERADLLAELAAERERAERVEEKKAARLTADELKAIKIAIGAIAAAAMAAHNRGEEESETAWNETADVILAMIAAREPNRPQGRERRIYNEFIDGKSMWTLANKWQTTVADIESTIRRVVLALERESASKKEDTPE